MKERKKQTKMILLIILLGVTLFFVIRNRDAKMPFDENISSITITQEKAPYSTTIDNVKEFVKEMKIKQWNIRRNYKLKFAPICYLNFEPSGKRIEILGTDENYAYAYFNNNYYEFPLQSYNYIMDMLDTKEGISEKYISITNTCTVNETGFVMEVLRYDVSDKSVSKIKSIPYSSQYPLTMYDEKTNKVYYTAEAEDKKGDELYVIDCQTNKSKQLTNDFFAINNIYYLEQGIFIAGVKRGEETAVRPYLYDIETGTIKDIPIGDDFFISCASYNPVRKDLYVAGYLETEDKKAFDEQDEDGNLQGICNYIYKYDGKSFEQVYQKDDCYIKSIVSVGEDLLIKWGKTYFDEHMRVSKIQKEKEEAFKFSDKDISSIVYDGLIYADSKSIFYIRQIEKEDDVVYQLCSYEIDSGNIEVLYEAPEDAAINNAQVIMA